ncbi:LAME_0E09406g1_1 [Lachancea meyersii CBS 8951]|uniref:LAME_0E09406g1_1 n=1 Tax=Lachancea meyersii CBS 8951 TaxID=1266667 RepID=A0A1G4JJF6_9SACH|nr:LAME_0E09406g1_1 [Lachancea meyersii CBS 8951]
MAEGNKRNRNRVPLSCTICRKRKVKCDKTRPHCTQCVKAGVAHLCHYMEQTWAEEAEKELSKDAELKQLRERIKALEKTLSKMHASSSGTPDSAAAGLEEAPVSQGPNISSQEPKLLDSSKYDSDELDLTRQFDMLHLKNNGTVHLGATHWLAIMKGDPYLKLLWGHIFMLREKMSDWVLSKRKGRSANATDNRDTHNIKGRCPVIHQPSSSTCPVSGMSRSNYPRDGKCPVDHRAFSPVINKEGIKEHSESPVLTANSQVSDGSVAKCPVAHKSDATAQTATCPVMHKPLQANRLSGSESPSSIPQPVTLPSFDKLTSKCPVIHDTSPPPPAGSATHPDNKTQDQAIAELCKMLPPKRVIASIVEKFFKHIYPVIPILDERSFKHQINQIIQVKDEGITLQLSKPSDCCTLGILIIILRITWLSLPQNACDVDLGPQCGALFIPRVSTATVLQSREDQFLMSYETSAKAIHLVRKYLIRLDELTSFSNSNVNLTTVQFAIFYKLYLMCCTEKTIDTQLNTFTSTSQDNEAHQMLLSSIVQMAFSCGLHRDPDNFPQLTASTNGKLNKEAVSNAERLKHTWRKTWYAIVSLDVQQSTSLGSPRLLRNLRDFSDTKLPCSSKIDYVRDIKELIVVKNYTLFFQIDLCIAAVLNHILNVSMAKTVRKFELDSLIKILKNLCFGDGNVSDALTKLVNKGLLFTTEGSVVDQSLDEFYPLPPLEEVLSPLPSSDSDKEKKGALPHERTTRALFFSKHIMLRMLLYLLNYILFTFYEPKGTSDPGTRPLAKEYAQEALNHAMDGFRNCLMFFSNAKASENGNGSIFNHMEVVLAPYCLDVGHRALQFMVCLILRARCGPLTGMNESPILNSAANTSSEEETDNGQAPAQKKECAADTNDLAKDIDLDVGEDLAEILMTRMTLFHKLTKQLSVKFYYAKRMMKSTGFFITLLKVPSGKPISGEGDSRNPHGSSGIAKMSRFFKNVPSLVMSASGDQIKRCPVYQDAIGFLPAANTGGSGQRTSFESSGQQLPPLFPAYQPITYTSNDLRRTSDVRDSDAKRRKLSAGNSRPVSPGATSFKNDNWKLLSPPIVGLGASPGHSPLPPTFNSEQPPLAQNHKNAINSTQQEKQGFALPSGPLMSFSPAALSENSSSADYAPDFEDFLMQNSNFNGLMINPSSIVEAVGFAAHSNSGRSGSLGVPVDFLPIDNSEIDGLGDLTPANPGFPIWD